MTGSLHTAAARAIRRLDHAVGRWSSTVRVLIDVRTPMNLAVLRPVWRCLNGDARITIAVAAEDRAAVERSLESDGLSHLMIDREPASRMRWDLAITADVWNHTPLHRCRRTMQFFHGVAGKYDLDDPGRLVAAGLDRFDRIAFINDDRMQRYLSAGVIRRDQAVLVGYPKGDDLLNGVWPAARVRRALGLAPSRPTVVYAPTFSPSSSLHLAGEAIIAALLATGANVIVKLHDRSMTPDPRHTNGVDWAARLAPFESDARFALARGADAGPFLSASEVLVTDHSTVGFEFALLDRPIVIYDAPHLKDAARIDSGKWALLRSMADVVDAPDRLERAVTAALADPARLRDARRRARALFANPGGATERALAAVYELLGLHLPPAHAPGSPRSGPVGLARA